MISTEQSVFSIHYSLETQYPEITPVPNTDGMDQKLLLKVFKSVIGTLDPTLTDVAISKDCKRSIKKRIEKTLIIPDNKL